MNAATGINLALILFLPAFLIVAGLYCAYPRKPRGARRWFADLCVLALAFVLAAFAMRWGYRAATGIGGPLWKNVVSTLLTFGTFLAVIAVALPLRARWLRARLGNL